MRTVDIKEYANKVKHLRFEGKKFVNTITGEIVTGTLGGMHTVPGWISSSKIAFEDAKGNSKNMLVRNFVKKYQIVID